MQVNNTNVHKLKNKKADKPTYMALFFKFLAFHASNSISLVEVSCIFFNCPILLKYFIVYWLKSHLQKENNYLLLQYIINKRASVKCTDTYNLLRESYFSCILFCNIIKIGVMVKVSKRAPRWVKITLTHFI